MYPIRFENIYFEKIWGGRDFCSFRENVPEGNIGESWDVACHENGTSIVANGFLKGRNFKDVISEYGTELVGNNVDLNNFPLLVKLINSKEKLSVQVHPGDEYAKRVENQQGKTEAWYVVDAEPNAKLIVGTKECNKDVFKKAIDTGNVEEYLNVIDVKKGDCFLINSGLVHAICEGLTIAEIQQNSDVTYRVFDYGRPREIHIEKSLDVINFDLKAINLSNNIENFNYGYSIIDFCENEYFGMKKINVYNKWNDEGDIDRFYILTCVSGEGYICSKDFKDSIRKGDSYFIPASLGKYSLDGNLEIIKSYPTN